MVKKSEALALPVETGITESPPTGLAPQGTDASQVMGLLNSAIDRGISPDALEKLLTLHERVAERSARLSFFNALAKFKREIPRIAHDKDTSKAERGGGKFSFTYASKAAIMAAIQPHMDANGLFLTFDTDASAPGFVTEVAWLHHVDGHKEKSSVTLPTDSNLPIGSQQKVGSAMSYGQRYALIAVLGLSLDEPGEDQVGKVAAQGTITAAQVAELQKLVDETKTDAGRFLNHFGIDSYGELPAGRFSEAVSILRAKQKRGQS